MKPAHKPQNIIADGKITITLLVKGSPEDIERTKQQVEHYAESLPGVHLEE